MADDDERREEEEEEEEDSKLEPEISVGFTPEENENDFFNKNNEIFTSDIKVFKMTEIDGVVTEEHLKDISHELGLIKLCWADVPQVQFDERLHYPIRYLQNNKKEKLLLWYAENFRQQIAFNYERKRPLLIACDNECGVQKMVSTTLHPTNMKFPEFQTWQGCARFVEEYLTYEELQSPTILPDHINSPQTVLKRQAGHSFEFSTLLVSFLIGSGYDAYVVSGYATREICRKDQTRIECPFLQDEPEIEEKEEVLEDTKYFLKKPVELESQFLADMEARELQKQLNAQKTQELAELEAIKEYEKPPFDDLWSWRLHSWVLILPSKDVSEPFFIESTTGVAKSISDPEYHGIESVWNHLNYWVLVQFNYKTETCKDISFNLNDQNCWERLLIGEPITFRELPQEILEAETEGENYWAKAEKHLDMPGSWVDVLKLSHTAYERRFSDARRKVYYRKAVSEQFSPYSQTDGLREKVTRFEDYECEQPREVREKYANRVDRMYFCQKTMANNVIIEKFDRGREDALKERFYYSTDKGIEAKFTLQFYSQARLDGLCKWDMDPLYMTMHFENRPDFLFYIHTEFAPKTNFDHPLRMITKITEKFNRNPEKDADKDVAEVNYLLVEKKLHLKFHYEPEHVTQADRIFLKPTFAEEGARITFDPSLTSGYLPGANTPPPKPLYLYRLQVEYFKQEELAKKRIREREDELLCLLRLRSQELAAPRLIVSEFDIERNADAKHAFLEREQEKNELIARDMNMICDFLSPYYAKQSLKPNAVLPLETAKQVIEECLQDWKNLLVARANEIQQQFEQTCQEFQERNNWYEQNQNTITKEQEEEYFDYCKKNSYYLHILEVRLNRHKEMAPQKYMAIQTYLKNDPRLAFAYQTKRKRRRE